MSGEFEAAGTAIEGALIAKAVESEGGDAAGKNSGKCLNCEAPVTGSYCNNCGQPLHIHRSIGAFWHDILHGVLHFEGKFWRTLPLLAWKPGDLTRRYIHGQRARFISPMALFLFSVFMMFAVFSFLGDPFAGGNGSETNKDFNTGVVMQTADIERQISEKEAEVESAEAADQAKLQQDLLDLKKGRNLLATMTGEDTPYPEVKLGDGAIELGNFSKEEIDQLQTGLDDIQEGNVLNDDSSVTTGSKDLDKTIRDGIKAVNENPDLLLYKLKANGYKFAWLLIPISLPFVWLTLIGRRGYHFYDHAVFTTYSISFMSLLFITCAILAALGVSQAIWVLLLVFYPPFHMYRQLRHAYKLSRIEALLRLSALLVFTVISMTLFFVILFAVGILG
ncbi:DUF3667 domain-containing protein [Parasphingorhabdus cellanae]|uniref:DUF3667 domain-containing protein n=1 Tax=Parasphingorhabdus cellanae TaxID=2806553 RepID=A0ABX7T6B2_9SPHN|nr:DUF3667 domain-containing protein [Parasphingorhabdus cellanae]QTD55755.1 DUF3667 domain-containing protein [Parasphingorhabdus cellanae]